MIKNRYIMLRWSSQSSINGLCSYTFKTWGNNLGKLKKYWRLMTGIRAYNTVPTLQSKQQVLFDFVKSGKRWLFSTTLLITAYQRYSPYPLKNIKRSSYWGRCSGKFPRATSSCFKHTNQITANDLRLEARKVCIIQMSLMQHLCLLFLQMIKEKSNKGTTCSHMWILYLYGTEFF
jgi:hypothetical protein